MAITNRERVSKGFELLRQGLVPFVEREFKTHQGGYWADELNAKLKYPLEHTEGGGLKWDNQAILKAMIDNWQSVFKQTLGQFERAWVGELLQFRNQLAHEEPFSSDDTLRALDSAQRLLQAVSAATEATEVEKLKFELQHTVYEEQARTKTRTAVPIEGKPKAGLLPWREIITPHPDVASGRYVQAEFAADLHNVHRGIGSDEYKDPVEFYRRTFITDGLRELLTGALQRLTGSGGDPVVELQTNFGGGKTHSLLALYHLFGEVPAHQLPGLEKILAAAGVDKAPTAHRAVLVGTHLSVGEVCDKGDGTVVRTMWGELAWQLGGKDGYRMVAESDAHGTSPGAQVLSDLFRFFTPALILIDEWVAYARNTVNKRDLPSGDFEAQATFAQALTEAAKAADRTLVVASIPSSKIEVGGQNGEFALATLKNVFERLGRPWRPASADEGFEIVRRRLFEPVMDRERFANRDAVLEAYSRMYRENVADFPVGCSEASYRKKLDAAYPIHPDVFDQLYGEWSTLDKFQRTRGVLRLLAKVIQKLWEGNDSGLLIMPSSLPMDDPSVKSELTRYLDDNWEPIISDDVDGPSSLPLELDRANPTLGRFSACRRVARTLYLGTAPGAKGRNPGIDDRRIRLGCTQPGEHAATFGDALRRLSDRAKHIHQDGSRYWISTKPNLNRLADDRAAERLLQVEELHAEIVRRVREEVKRKEHRGDFAGVHACPESSSEVHDDPEARLVILGPKHTHRKGQDGSAAMTEARAILDRKGNTPRLNRNCLVFLAADPQRLSDLQGVTAQYLAWQSIHDEHEALNLDAFQRKLAESKAKGTTETVDLQIRETWIWAMIPGHREPKPGEQLKPEELIAWDVLRINGGEPLAKRVSAKLRQDELLLTHLAGVRLRMSLDGFLWKDKDHVSVAELTEWFPRYLYLPRLKNREAVLESVKDGCNVTVVDETFALATSYDQAKHRYLGLKLGGGAPRSVENSMLVVKPPVARKQIAWDDAPKCPTCEALEPDWHAGDQTCGKCGYAPPRPPERKCPKCGAREPHWKHAEGKCGKCGHGTKVVAKTCPKCGVGEPTWNPAGGRCASCDKPPVQKPNVFVGSIQLDGSRLGRDAGKVAEEVLQHLSVLPGARVKVTLEIHVEVPGGVDEGVVRTVSENCRTLKFGDHGFEVE